MCANAPIKKAGRNYNVAPDTAATNAGTANHRIVFADLQTLPIAGSSPIPLYPENYALAYLGDFKDMGTFKDWQVKYSNAEPENVSIELHPESKKNKVLYVLAKLTCKGLHKITGQHIVMEKKFDADTTNVIAYQLDLGNKKIEFPVKE